MAEQDKRDFERIDLLGLLQGEVKVFQPTAVRQMSRGGMRIETRFALQLDALHDFRLTIGEQSVVVRGRVVHSHISEVDQDVVVYVSGVQFIELSPHATTVINEFLELLRLARLKI